MARGSAISGSRSRHGTGRSAQMRPEMITAASGDFETDFLHDDVVEETVSERVNRRGCNVPKRAPAKESERLIIKPTGLRYKQPFVSRTITGNFRQHINGPYDTWKKVPQEVKDALWSNFKETFTWQPDHECAVRCSYEDTVRCTYKDSMRQARHYAETITGTRSDVELWKPYCPKWLGEETWHSLIDNVFKTDVWQAKANRNKMNRALMCENVAPTHCGGSAPFVVTAMKLAIENDNTTVSQPQVFEETHRKDNGRGEWVNERARTFHEEMSDAMIEKHGSEVSNHPVLDEEVWSRLAPPCKGLVYELGTGRPDSMVASTSRVADVAM